MPINKTMDPELFNTFMRIGQKLAYGGTAALIVISCLALFYGHTWVGLAGLAAAVTSIGIIFLVAGTVELLVRTSSALGQVGTVTRAIAEWAGYDVDELTAPEKSDVT